MSVVETPKAVVDHLCDDLGMTMTAAAEELGVSRTTVANRRRSSGRAALPCPACGEPMRDPAPRCGFCIAEAQEVAA